MMLRTINVVLVTKDADGHARAGNLRQLNGPAETLITLGIVAAVTSIILPILGAVISMDRPRKCMLIVWESAFR
jgi:hypothetical protein